MLLTAPSESKKTSVTIFLRTGVVCLWLWPQHSMSFAIFAMVLSFVVHFFGRREKTPTPKTRVSIWTLLRTPGQSVLQQYSNRVFWWRQQCSGDNKQDSPRTVPLFLLTVYASWVPIFWPFLREPCPSPDNDNRKGNCCN